MMLKNTVFLTALCGALAVGAAQAAPVTLTFSGLVNQTTGPTAAEIGERVSGAITLDDATPGTPGASVGTDYAITSFMLTLPDGTMDSFGGNGTVNVRNDCVLCVNPGSPAVDGFSFGAADGANGTASLILSTTLTTLLADEGLSGVIAIFDAGTLPSTPMTFTVSTRNDQTTGLDRYGNDCSQDFFCQFLGQVDLIGVAANDMTPVPLPAGLPLLLAGLGGLAVLRRRG